MNFDKSRVYTALNAEELKVGSKVICAFTIKSLKKQVEEYEGIMEVRGIYPESYNNRFCVDFENACIGYPIAFLVEEPKEKQLKWTELKLGDVLTNGKCMAMVTAIDKESKEVHIFAGNEWFRDINLAEWVKVEE